MVQKQILVFTLALLTIGSDLFAQFVKQIGIEVGYDDNAFRNYAQISDYSTSLNFYLAKDFTGKKWEHRLFYDSYYNLYRNYNQRFSHYHQVGYIAATSFFDQGDVFSASSLFAVNQRTEDYNYANYVQAAAYSNYKFRPWGSTIMQFGWKGKYHKYENLSQLTHLENMLFSRFSWFLPTRTSLIFYTRLGFKKYNSQTIETTTEVTVQGSGNGQGTGGENNQLVTSSSEIPGITASQLILNLKIGQSLTEKTGLSLQYQRRLNLNKHTRLSTDFDFEMLVSEEDIYDDPYGYESHEIHSELTRLLPRSFKIKAGYSYYFKQYQIEALGLDGFPVVPSGLRKDKRYVGWFNITKIFPKNKLLRNIKLSLDFYYLKNISNDAYYDFDNSSFTFGSEFMF